MNHLSDGRLIDILSKIDLALTEEDFLDRDLEHFELAPKEKKEGKKRIAVISGIAAGSVALTGVIVLLMKKHDMLRRAAA